ncbi:MAG: hypothetical protein ACQEQ4_06590 [Fibrobacterota bacterium]
MNRENLSPEEYENLFEELNAIINSGTSLSQSVNDELDDDVIDVSRDDEILREAFLNKPQPPVNNSDTDTEEEHESPREPAEENIESFFQDVKRSQSRGEDTAVDFVCPLCRNTACSPRYASDSSQFRFIAYECTRCSVFFKDPRRFTAKRKKKDTEAPGASKTGFSCPLCKTTSYETNYTQDIGEISVEAYYCSGCSVLFSDPEKFSADS